MENLGFAIVGAFIVGLVIGWKVHDWIVNALINLDMKNGQLFVYRNGRWFPHNPRENHKGLE